MRPGRSVDLAGRSCPKRSAGDLAVAHRSRRGKSRGGTETPAAQGTSVIGLVGSRRHTGHHLKRCGRRACPKTVIAQIPEPGVGLDLGAVTPGEIALSILPES